VAVENTRHVPVLVNKVMELLNCRPDGIFVDATLGEAGHAEQILERSARGILIGIDRDDEVLKLARMNLERFKNRVSIVCGDFRDLREITANYSGKINGILLDLGLSSFQLDSDRGFSFQHDSPLDMRMSGRGKITAADLVNNLSQSELFFLLRDFGQERFAGRIARRIVRARHTTKFTTTGQLARFIERTVPRTKIHPATRTFQALRIKVNDELSALEKCLESVPEILCAGGRAVVISFHSLEDAIVKKAFRLYSDRGIARLLIRKPVMPAQEEIEANPRSRSAKLRAVEKN